MIQRFCDCCGTEIKQNYASERLEAERTFRHDAKRVVVKVECMVTMDGVTNKGDICRDCVIDTVNMADTRPQSAPISAEPSGDE